MRSFLVASEDNPTERRATSIDVVNALMEPSTSEFPTLGDPSTRNKAVWVLNGLIRRDENWSYNRLMAAKEKLKFYTKASTTFWKCEH